MAPTKYSYTISVDFPAAKVNVTQLIDTIRFDPSITIALDSGSGIVANYATDLCDIWFVDPLPVPDEAALNAVVAAHQGVGIVAEMPGSVRILDQDITEDLTWQEIGSVITTPTFFVDDDPALLTELFGRLINQVMGDGGEIKLVEEVAGQPDVDILPATALPNTGGLWQDTKFDSQVTPRDGVRNRYAAYARLNGAAACKVRSGSLSMIRVHTY